MGLLFALLPVLGGTSGVLQGMLSMAKSYAFDLPGSSVKIFDSILLLFSLVMMWSNETKFLTLHFFWPCGNFFPGWLF